MCYKTTQPNYCIHSVGLVNPKTTEELVSACAALDNESQMSSCLVLVARDRREEDVCSYIPIESKRKACEFVIKSH